MNQGNEIFKTLLQEAYDTHRKIEQHNIENDSLPIGQRRKKVDPHLERKLFFLIVGILTFIGVEPVKVIFRKNLGAESFNMFRLVLAAFLFFVLGVWGLAVFIDWRKASQDTFLNSEGRTSFLLTGAFFTWLAVYSIVKGVHHKRKVKYFPKHYKGDAHLLAFMEKEGIKHGAIRLWWEPLYVILIGILFMLFVNLVGGIPIIACGLSVWFYEAIQTLFFPDREQELKDHNDWKKERDNEDFYEIPQQ